MNWLFPFFHSIEKQSDVQKGEGSGPSHSAGEPMETSAEIQVSSMLVSHFALHFE